MTTAPGSLPRCSIIIPLFNQVAYTARCLTRLVDSTDPELYEVVLIDNGSTDATADLLANVSGHVTIIRNPTNLGFARACNQGAAASSTGLLLFLNNDTEPLPGWLEPLLATVASDAAVGAVGSRLLFADGTLQHAGAWVVEDRRAAIPLIGVHRYTGAPADHPPAMVPEPVGALTGACLLVRRDAFEAAGGFDEGYWNGCEDLDLCFSLAAAGWGLVYEPASCLVHHESASGPERWRAVNDNVRRLGERWAGRVVPDLLVDEAGVVHPHPALAWRPDPGLRAAGAVDGRGLRQLGPGSGPGRADASRTRSDAPVRVLYRYSEEAPGRPSRPRFFDKDVALASFLRAVSAASTRPSVVFVADGALNSRTRVAMERFGPVVTISKRGNSGSYRLLLDVVRARGWERDALVYFAEDDYLYRAEAFDRLAAAAAAFPHAEYFTLYDHPDRYGRADDADTGRVDVYLAPPGQHWRTAESTCMTFAARTGAIHRDMDAQIAGLAQEIPMDRPIWRHTLFERPRAQGPGAPRPVLLSPIPSLATHCHDGFLAPGVDWDAEARAAWAWADDCGLWAAGRSVEWASPPGGAEPPWAAADAATDARWAAADAANVAEALRLADAAAPSAIAVAPVPMHQIASATWS